MLRISLNNLHSGSSSMKSNATLFGFNVILGQSWCGFEWMGVAGIGNNAHSAPIQLLAQNQTSEGVL